MQRQSEDPVADICYIADIGHHYRQAIFDEMASSLNCTFFFSDRKVPIRQINNRNDNRFKWVLKHRNVVGKFYFLAGAPKIALKFKSVILLGDPYGLHNWIILIMGRLCGVRVFLWTHGLYGKENFLRLWLKLAMFRLAKKIFVYGPRSKRLLIEKGYPERLIYVVYNSLDLERQKEIYSQCRPTDIYIKYFGNLDPVIIYIGRIQKVKKIGLIVDLVGELKKRGRSVNCILIGDEQDESIRRLVAQKKLDSNFWFYGPTYNEREISVLIYNADVCLSPGNVGLTVIHSLTYGCPVITHNEPSLQMPEYAAIKRGVTGDFFLYNSFEDMLTVVSRWIDLVRRDKESIRHQCHNEVHARWNAKKQIEIMAQAVLDL